MILQRRWDCVLCPSLLQIPSRLADEDPQWSSATLGLALPLETFQLDDAALETYYESLRRIVAARRPAILTTAGDIPVMTDMKRMTKVLETVPRAF